MLTVFVSGHDAFSAFVSRSLFDMPAESSGRVSLLTGICIVLLAAGSSSGSDPTRHHDKSVRLGHLACGVALVTSGLAVLAYLYDARLMLTAAPFEAMAFPTALALFLLSLATLAAQPAHGWVATLSSPAAGGSATRRQLLFTLLPIGLGLLLIQAIRRGLIEPNSAIVLLVVMTIVPLAILVLRDGAMLEKLDGEKNRNAKQQLQMNIELGERLAAQATQLQLQAQERLHAEAVLAKAQRLEAVGQLTGGIAHDFNNLLMAVKGNLDLMRRRLTEDHPATRYVDNANAAAAKGTKITQQLLAFSRTQRLEIRPVEIVAELNGALELIGRALDSGTSVSLQLDDADAWALTDPDQLELALLNLAINSRDAMASGGHVRLRQSIRTTTSADDGSPVDHVVIGVTDEGAGMSPEVAARATEPFFTTKMQGKGTGLGLAQAYGFAKQCGGDLKIVSVEGEGTTVEIWLRRVAALNVAGPLLPPHAASGIAATRNRRVLVIDDDEFVRGAIVSALREGGQTVIEASDGPNGLFRLSEFRPDVAVVDFLMPGMNGAEVARAAQRNHPGLPIVFVSGYSDTLALDGITNSVVLRKPFEFDALFMAIEDVVAG